jgi:hypothetical protein
MLRPKLPAAPGRHYPPFGRQAGRHSQNPVPVCGRLRTNPIATVNAPPSSGVARMADAAECHCSIGCIQATGQSEVRNVRAGKVIPVDATCAQCGSRLRPNAPFCGACGRAATNRQVAPPPVLPATVTAPAVSAGIATQSTVLAAIPVPTAPDQVVLAGRGLRACRALFDTGVLISPALPLSAVAIILQSPAIAYVVVPVAILALWIWMQLWQGLTGRTFGGTVLGLRTLRVADRGAPGFGACALRGALFATTAGLATWPVPASVTACRGWHDRYTGLAVIDISLGANPLGPRQQSALRRTIDRSLRSVASPVPLPGSVTGAQPVSSYTGSHRGRN